MLFKTLCNKLFKKKLNFIFRKIAQLGLPFIKRWEYTKNLFDRINITQSCSLRHLRHFKMFTNSGNF